MEAFATFWVLFLAGAITVEVDAFCMRPYDFPDWEEQSLTKRSQDADIIIFAEILSSPCKKPTPPTTSAPSTVPTTKSLLSTNATSNRNATANATTTPKPTTAAPTTPTTLPPTTAGPIHNCSYELYNTTLKVLCVIKGGSMPEIIHLSGIGIDEKEMCVHEFLNETAAMYHLYDDGQYLIFLRRNEDIEAPDVFIPYRMNHQPASTEIQYESELKDIFRVAGRHAHTANEVWANKTHAVCKPYYNGAGSIMLSITTLLITGLFAVVSAHIL